MFVVRRLLELLELLELLGLAGWRYRVWLK
jgi:hypothetical protein